MDGNFSLPLRGFGPDPFVLFGSFQCNASSDPSSTTFRGPTALKGFTVSYAATGVFTVTLPEGFTLPAQAYCVAAWPQYATLATDWFECGIVGETTLNASTRQFVVQAHRSGTAREVANTAGNRINFAIFCTNSGGG